MNLATRLIVVLLLGCVAGLFGCSSEVAEQQVEEQPVELVRPDTDGVRHVRPGEEIQPALDAAAADPVNKKVIVHAGTYRPQSPGQALIWLNARHDGIQLEAEGEVILTAANPEISDPMNEGHPSVVNHVVYFGNGVSRETIFRGFKVTGANHFVTRSDKPVSIEPNADGTTLKKELFFYNDGGGIKIFGSSYPTIVNVEVFDNYASPCGGAVSVEHQGHQEDAVTFRNCIFWNNRCKVTGSAIDVLPGSSAVIENCLFVGNVANTGWDDVSPTGERYNYEHGSGALTVFRESRVTVTRCTFTGNWNGIDDKGEGNIYKDSIFWNNNRSGGIAPKGRYELDIVDGQGVTGCFITGEIGDLRKSIDQTKNEFDCPDPDFDDDYRPQTKQYANVGYRPVTE